MEYDSDDSILDNPLLGVFFCQRERECRQLTESITRLQRLYMFFRRRPRRQPNPGNPPLLLPTKEPSPDSSKTLSNPPHHPPIHSPGDEDDPSISPLISPFRTDHRPPFTHHRVPQHPPTHTPPGTVSLRFRPRCDARRDANERASPELGTIRDAWVGGMCAPAACMTAGLLANEGSVGRVSVLREREGGGRGGVGGR